MSSHPLDHSLDQLGWRRFNEGDVTDSPIRVRLICYNAHPDKNETRLTVTNAVIWRGPEGMAVGLSYDSLNPFLQTLLARSGALQTSEVVLGVHICSCWMVSALAQWSPFCVPLLHEPSMDDVIRFAWIAEMFRHLVTQDPSWQCHNPSHLLG